MEVKRVEDALQLVGEILNTTDETRPMPPLYGVLQDANGKQLSHWQLQVDVQQLGPGEKVPFTTEIATIPEGTANVSVLFTNPAENL